MTEWEKANKEGEFTLELLNQLIESISPKLPCKHPKGDFVAEVGFYCDRCGVYFMGLKEIRGFNRLKEFKNPNVDQKVAKLLENGEVVEYMGIRLWVSKNE